MGGLEPPHIGRYSFIGSTRQMLDFPPLNVIFPRFEPKLSILIAVLRDSQCPKLVVLFCTTILTEMKLKLKSKIINNSPLGEAEWAIDPRPPRPSGLIVLVSPKAIIKLANSS